MQRTNLDEIQNSNSKLKKHKEVNFILNRGFISLLILGVMIEYILI